MEVCISKGYVFQMEMIVRARQHGYTVGEVSHWEILQKNVFFQNATPRNEIVKSAKIYFLPQKFRLLKIF